jgi:hypothetical protein
VLGPKGARTKRFEVKYAQEKFVQWTKVYMVLSGCGEGIRTQTTFMSKITHYWPGVLGIIGVPGGPLP